MSSNTPVLITGLGALSALGEDLASHRQAILAKQSRFRPLGELLGRDSPHANHRAAWIENRSALTHRKWSPVTMAGLHVAKQAVAHAGWSPDECRNTALVVATSRGNAAGWLGPWPGRRPFRLMAASNTIHSEPASAITIELGILGPNHVLASGCSAGLDAIGIALLMLRAGLCERALAVAVDLPLVPMLLDNYAASGLLSTRNLLDPYHPGTSGFLPGEGAAAMALECKSRENGVQIMHYACNSDGVDPVGIPADGGRTPELFEGISDMIPSIRAICPHATGTAVQRAADPAWLRRVFGNRIPPIHMLKPNIGHTIGASGLIESVLLADAMADGFLPPNHHGLHAPEGISLTQEAVSISGAVAKISHGMGGHNALVVLSNCNL
jgi:3-oxoacyl-[acyl-carrier-protein] synthase II